MKFHEIIPGRLYQRGEFSTFSPKEKLEELRQRDIRYVINLVKRGDPDLPAHVFYFHKPIPDGRHTPLEELMELARLVVKMMRYEGGAALTHCHAGRNRSGFFNALIAREWLGISGAEALALVRDRRPNAIANEFFVEQLVSLPLPNGGSKSGYASSEDGSDYGWSFRDDAGRA